MALIPARSARTAEFPLPGVDFLYSWRGYFRSQHHSQRKLPNFLPWDGPSLFSGGKRVGERGVVGFKASAEGELVLLLSVSLCA